MSKFDIDNVASYNVINSWVNLAGGNRGSLLISFNSIGQIDFQSIISLKK